MTEETNWLDELFDFMASGKALILIWFVVAAVFLGHAGITRFLKTLCDAESLTVTTNAIDTTGASMLFVVLTFPGNADPDNKAIILIDNKGNTLVTESKAEVKNSLWPAGKPFKQTSVCPKDEGGFHTVTTNNKWESR